MNPTNYFLTILLTVVCVLPSTKSHAQDTCKSLFSDLNRQKVLAVERSAWNSAVTDPQSHDPQNFAYLVHGIAYGDHSLSKTADFLAHGPTSGGYRISMSYVTSLKPFSVVGKVGFLLSIHPNDILAAHPEDFNIINETYAEPGQSQEAFKKTFRQNSEDELFSRYRKHYGVKILSPAELIEKTRTNDYNEVLALNEGSNKVKIVGLFIIASKKNTSVKIAKLIEEAQQMARESNLPLVILP